MWCKQWICLSLQMFLCFNHIVFNNHLSDDIVFFIVTSNSSVINSNQRIRDGLPWGLPGAAVVRDWCSPPCHFPFPLFTCGLRRGGSSIAVIPLKANGNRAVALRQKPAFCPISRVGWMEVIALATHLIPSLLVGSETKRIIMAEVQVDRLGTLSNDVDMIFLKAL